MRMALPTSMRGLLSKTVGAGHRPARRIPSSSPLSFECLSHVRELTFLRILLRHALGHLCDDGPQLSGVLLDADFLFRVEIGLHSLAEDNLRENGAQAVWSRPGVCRGKVSLNLANDDDNASSSSLMTPAPFNIHHGDGDDV